jgi:glycosyltransferase involved in cell wall biosynthesis
VPSRRPVILHIITGLGTGGAEIMLEKLVTAPGTFGHVVVSLGGKGAIGPRLEARGVPVHALELKSPRGLATGFSRLLRIVRDLSPAAIQGWMNHANLIATLANRRLGRAAPLLWNVRQSLGDLAYEKWLTRRVIALNARLSGEPAMILYNSRAGAEQHEAIGYASEKRHLIANGFDLARFAPSPERRRAARRMLGIARDDIVIGLVARIHPMKNHVGFLEAAALVLAREPKARFLLAGAGAGDDHPSFAALFPNEAVRARTLVLGARDDVPEIMAALDIFCLPSVHGEGFPNAVGEAMAMGVPCVVADTGDSAAIVGDTGLVTQGTDGPAIAAALDEMIALGPKGRAALGARAAERVARLYALPAILAEYEAVWTEVARAG